MLTMALYLIPLGLLSCLSFWKPNPILFMVTAGFGIVFGFSIPDFSGVTSTTKMEINLAMMVFVFALFCIAAAFRLLFWRAESDDE